MTACLATTSIATIAYFLPLFGILMCFMSNSITLFGSAALRFPLTRLLSKALTPLFDRLLNGLVSARKKKVVALYDIRDRRAAGNLVLLVIPQEYGPDFLCRVCRVLLPDSSYLLHDFRANSLPPHPLWSACPVLKPGNPMLLEAPVPAIEV